MSILESIRSAGRPFYLICTGGGAGFQQHVWETPGISDVLLGAEFPYAKEATDACLGFEPAKYVIPDTAIDLAMTAFYKGVSRKTPNPIGLGLTAAVASNRAHRGDHRVFVATVSDAGCRLFLVELEKGEGAAQRKKDGDICDTLALFALAKAVGLPSSLLADDIARIVSTVKVYKDVADIDNLASERLFDRPFFTATGKREASWRSKGFLFPGAFNPPHFGHFQLAQAALQEPHTCESHVTFMVSRQTPNKPPLTVPDMLRRAKFLEGHDRKFTRDDPLYLDKAANNPGAAFIVGVDAVERLIDPKWGLNIDHQFQKFEQFGTRFYVAGRMVEGRFKTLSDVNIPRRWARLFEEVHGRWDVSSSEIRATG